MKIFDCPNCSSPLFFENTKCVSCGSSLGFDPDELLFKSVSDDWSGYCKNHELGLCNWLISGGSKNTFCPACALNRKVPNASDGENFEKWKPLETAKHRLVYQLLKLGLPLVPKSEADEGLAFDFLGSDNDDNKMTGHANGVVTIILTEADSVHREQLRKQMSEAYRTLLGHFRHEIGHYYWPLLFKYENLDRFRFFFGDERKDYGASLEQHYATGAPQNWNENFITAYASSHPWEDWAETWAHYLHLMDTLETAGSLGLSLKPEISKPSYLEMAKAQDPYTINDFKIIFDASISLTCAANSLNRSMGLPDIYPFIIADTVYEKLNFIHEILKDYRQRNT